MLTELWHRRADLHGEVQALRDMGLRGKQANLRCRALYKHINVINEMFDVPQEHFDPVTTRWSEQIARGETPDLGAHVRKLKVPDSLKAHMDRLLGQKAPP